VFVHAFKLATPPPPALVPKLLEVMVGVSARLLQSILSEMGRVVLISEVLVPYWVTIRPCKWLVSRQLQYFWNFHLGGQVCRWAGGRLLFNDTKRGGEQWRETSLWWRLNYNDYISNLDVCSPGMPRAQIPLPSPIELRRPQRQGEWLSAEEGREVP
jgi:hypothetical protein